MQILIFRLFIPCTANISALTPQQLRNDSCVRLLNDGLARFSKHVDHIFYLEEHILPVFNNRSCALDNMHAYLCAKNVPVEIAKRLQQKKTLDDLFLSFKV